MKKHEQNTSLLSSLWHQNVWQMNDRRLFHVQSGYMCSTLAWSSLELLHKQCMLERIIDGNMHCFTVLLLQFCFRSTFLLSVSCYLSLFCEEMLSCSIVAPAPADRWWRPVRKSVVTSRISLEYVIQVFVSMQFPWVVDQTGKSTCSQLDWNFVNDAMTRKHLVGYPATTPEQKCAGSVAPTIQQNTNKNV